MADKMHIYEDLKEMVEDEIDKIVKKGEIDEKCLEYLDKLVDISKDIDTINAMNEYGGEEPGYSQMRRPYYNSYDDGMTNRNSYQRRDGMGRYMRSYDNGGGYSRGGGNIAARLESMMAEASTEHEREAIRRALEQM